MDKVKEAQLKAFRAIGGKAFEKELAATHEEAVEEIRRFFADGKPKRSSDLELAMLGELTPISEVLKGNLYLYETIYNAAFMELLDSGEITESRDKGGNLYEKKKD